LKRLVASKSHLNSAKIPNFMDCEIGYEVPGHVPAFHKPETCRRSVGALKIYAWNDAYHRRGYVV